MPTKVSDVMEVKPYIERDTSTLGEIAKILASRKEHAVILAAEDGGLTGIYTETDLAQAFVNEIPLDTPMRRIMTNSPATVSPHTSLESCASIMTNMGCRHLPVVDERGIVGMVGILSVQDAILSKIRRQVSELENAQIELSRRDEYLAMAAHDIRSPLCVIKICFEMFGMLGKKITPEEQKELIERVDQNIVRAQKLLNDLLDIGQLKNGLKLRLERVPVAPYLESIVENEKLVAKQKNIQIALRCDPDIQAEIDRERYSEIIVNLITNAVKFSPAGSEIEVSTEVIDRQWLKVSVKDRGPGIKPEDQERLFSPYAKLGHPQVSAGFGLGLSIAQQFAVMHKGRVELESVSGKGSTFHVITPIKSVSDWKS